MRRRARRVTLAAAVLGAGVVAVLLVTHWGTVRDHMDAWRFRLTTETKTIEPHPQHGPLDVKVTPHLSEKDALIGIHGFQPGPNP